MLTYAAYVCIRQHTLAYVSKALRPLQQNKHLTEAVGTYSLFICLLLPLSTYCYLGTASLICLLLPLITYCYLGTASLTHARPALLCTPDLLCSARRAGCHRDDFAKVRGPP